MPVLGIPCGSDGKESACNSGHLDLITGLGRSLGEGNGYPLQYSCLGNPWTEKPGGLQSMELQLKTIKLVTLFYIFGNLGRKKTCLLKNVAYLVRPTENLLHTHY